MAISKNAITSEVHKIFLWKKVPGKLDETVFLLIYISGKK